MKLLLVSLLILVLFKPLLSQPLSPKEIRDNRGREFWVTFPLNDHNTPSAERTDSLYFFIATERPTRVTIRFVRDNTTREFFIRNTNEMRIIGFPYNSFELSRAETARREVFEITSDEEISVYGMNFADRTTDAFLAFPKDVLGREYFIFSYQSNILRPSNFAIVATENDTQIEINPTQPTGRFGLMTQQFTLQKGEAYYVTAQLRSVQDTTDLTGTRVNANKPIAVFAGHRRANIIYTPLRMDDVPRTQDYMIEQMIPTNVWRNTCFVVPLAQPGPFTTFRLPFPDTSRSDIVRILAAQDSTIIAISEAPNSTLQNTTTPTVTLNRGRFYEMGVGQPAVVRANKPIAAMIYRKSGSGGSFGDPFMAALPPVEQYLNRYKYLNVQGEQAYLIGRVTRFLTAFNEHYVSVVIPTVKASTLRINGNALNGVQFRPIGETGYSYGLIGSEATVYDITADTTFGITVYGYGEANSYGYIGGMRFETDTLAPRIVPNPSCFRVDGTIYDNDADDSKIFWYESPDTSRRNVNFRFEPLPRPADSLRFLAGLLNQYEDGAFSIITTDSLDLITRRRFFIPGFTVHVNAALRRNEVVQLSTNAIALAAGLERCFDLTLTNYGSTTQVISSLDFTGKNGVPQREFYTAAALPIVLLPRQQRRVSVCFRSDNTGFFTDTVRIGNDCVKRPIAIVSVESGFDRTPPAMIRQADSCGRSISYRFTDNHLYASGVASVRLNTDSTQNASVMTARNADGSIAATVMLTNPRRDGIVSFIVRDSVGNTRFVRDTIQGSPLRFVLPPSSLTSATRTVMNLGATEARGITCQSVQVWNDGLLPFVLTRPALQENITFSLPPSQFPLVIPPGRFQNLNVCFAPDIVRDYQDVMTIRQRCDIETIALSGRGAVRFFEAFSRCSVTVRITPPIDTIKNAMAMTHFPDPVHNEISLHIANAIAGEYQFEVYSVIGTPIVLMPIRLEAAERYELGINTNQLAAGTYHYILRKNEQVFTGAFRVVK